MWDLQLIESPRYYSDSYPRRGNTVGCDPHFRNFRKLRWKWYQTLVSCLGRNYPQCFEIHFVRFGFIPISKNWIFLSWAKFGRKRRVLLIEISTFNHVPTDSRQDHHSLEMKHTPFQPPYNDLWNGVYHNSKLWWSWMEFDFLWFSYYNLLIESA